MTSIPLPTQANFDNPEFQAQDSLSDDSSLNQALIAVAQEVAELLRQAYPVQDQTKPLFLNHDNQHIQE
jgi:hypothetical protein